MPFKPKTGGTASESGSIAEPDPRLFGEQQEETKPETPEALGLSALRSLQWARHALNYETLSEASDLARTNVEGVPVYFSGEGFWSMNASSIADIVNDYIGSGSDVLSYNTTGFSTITSMGTSFLDPEYTSGMGIATWGQGDWSDIYAIGRPVNVDPSSAYRQAIAELKTSFENLAADFKRRLDAIAATHAQTDPREVVRLITRDHGVGQLTVARAVGVSPTAVRKWRRGDSATPENRTKLSQFAALADLLGEAGIHDCGGWLNIPISSESTLTPLDLYLAGRADLVLLFANRLEEPRAVLTRFNPDWRTVFGIDEEYVVIQHGDGSRSAVPRRET